MIRSSKPSWLGEIEVKARHEQLNVSERPKTEMCPISGDEAISERTPQSRPTAKQAPQHTSPVHPTRRCLTPLLPPARSRGLRTRLLLRRHSPVCRVRVTHTSQRGNPRLHFPFHNSHFSLSSIGSEVQVHPVMCAVIPSSNVLRKLGHYFQLI